MKLLTVSLVLVTAASIAHADDGVTVTSDRRDHSRVAATIGLGMPTGEAGIELDYAFHNVPLDLAIGTGVALGGGDRDPQLSVMPRFRYRLGPITASLGAGLSGGHYAICYGFDCNRREDMTALWANVEAGLQVSSKLGPFVRLFAGTGYVVAHGRIVDDDGMTLARPGEPLLPYVGLAVGYAF